MNIRAEFQTHDVTPEQVDRINEVRRLFTHALTGIEIQMPPSRERSLVVTKLQEACMWAVRGIAAPNGARMGPPAITSSSTAA